MSDYSYINETNDSSYKKVLWDTAKGLQAVDGLKTSEYLNTIAEENIDNKISYDEALDKLYSYYGSMDKIDYSQKQADIVSARIVQFLNTHTFTPGIAGLIGIHEFLFKDELSDLEVGRFRNHNIFKAESILNGDTVNYGDANTIRIALDVLFSSEKKYEYSYPMTSDDISHLSEYISELWQIHPFAEGNTRSTAVYIIMYLRTKGIDINNDLFNENSSYFRNALVRSVYENLRIGVRSTYKYINIFLENLLCGANHPLLIDDLKVPYNQEYSDEIERKLARIAGPGISNNELMTFSNDRNVNVRIAAQQEIRNRINSEDVSNEMDEPEPEDDIDI